MADDVLYIFCDEAGNFDFSVGGTRFFIYTALTTTDPLPLCNKLSALRYQLMAEGACLERFHATEDRQAIRDRVLDILAGDQSCEIDSLIVRKNRLAPVLRPVERFYPEIVFYHLLRHILRRHQGRPLSRVVIVTDVVEVKGMRKALEKGVKENLERILHEQRWVAPYLLLHHESKSSGGLQAVDYCNWAVYVKWSRNELRPYARISPKIRSELDIFASGLTDYY